ncbi:MAG TPA: phosphoribosyltransferase family protein [Cyclobacteriaceae bacterium]|jgi:pyrimidine operon attenuation protein/uracil phosphoribosyltransferase|nr:phosphoribosyltransferase [Cyclobacteriaceae bacterium]HRK52399.1 phosphoribosyltransferase family protein [Cyclobacteriaceae bacterium]
MTEVEKSLVLTKSEVEQKIRRIAFEIYEDNFKEKSIVLAGIDGQGYTFAKLISEELESISPIVVKIVKVSLDKLAPQQSEVKVDCEEKDFRKKCIVIVDDVLNTGKTIAFGMKPFLNVEVKKIEVAVLVNRSHTLFPILPTYTGFELSTTLNERVEVVLGKKAAVYLH